MKLIKSLFLLNIFFLFLNGCSSFSEAGKVLRNDKQLSSDEFLIKKKKPLTVPPDFENIPEPNTNIREVKTEKDRIETIINKSKSKSSKIESKTSSIETSILNQIK